MSLTCNFRGLADQVRNRFGSVSQERRSSSTHACHESDYDRALRDFSTLEIMQSEDPRYGSAVFMKQEQLKKSHPNPSSVMSYSMCEANPSRSLHDCSRRSGQTFDAKKVEPSQSSCEKRVRRYGHDTASSLPNVPEECDRCPMQISRSGDLIPGINSSDEQQTYHPDNRHAQSKRHCGHTIDPNIVRANPRYFSKAHHYQNVDSKHPDRTNVVPDSSLAPNVVQTGSLGSAYQCFIYGPHMQKKDRSRAKIRITQNDPQTTSLQTSYTVTSSAFTSLNDTGMPRHIRIDAAIKNKGYLSDSYVKKSRHNEATNGVVNVHSTSDRIRECGRRIAETPSTNYCEDAPVLPLRTTSLGSRKNEQLMLMRHNPNSTRDQPPENDHHANNNRQSIPVPPEYPTRRAKTSKDNDNRQCYINTATIGLTTTRDYYQSSNVHSSPPSINQLVIINTRHENPPHNQTQPFISANGDQLNGRMNALQSTSSHSGHCDTTQVTGSVSNISSSDVWEQNVPDTHAKRLLYRMSDKLRDGRLADVILIAGMKNEDNRSNENDDFVKPIRIPAHRIILAAASDYFAAMFGNELKEASQSEVWIRDVDPNALQVLVNYVYTGYLNLCEETAGIILEAACFLQMTDAAQKCERYLIKRLDSGNCLAMTRLAEQHGCRLLQCKARNFTLEHFVDVMQQTDFVHLSLTELVDLLSSDHLRVPNEASVFAAALRWMRSSVASGQDQRPTSDLIKLFHHIRFQYLPPRLLADALLKEPLFQTDLPIIHILVTGLSSHLCLNPLALNNREVTHQTTPDAIVYAALANNNHSSETQENAIENDPTSSHTTSSHSPRPSTIGKLWALGGKTMTTTRALQEILEYDPYWNQWHVVGYLPGQREQCGCIALDDGRLLVVGGRDELKTLSTVECVQTDEFNTTLEPVDQRNNMSGIERSISSLHRSLVSSTTATITDHDSMVQSLVESQTNNDRPMEQSMQNESTLNSHWKVVSAMATHRHGLGVAVMEGVVYAVGGHDGWSYLNTVERWNGKAKSWSPVNPMAVQRSTVGVAALDGLLYAVGGRDGSACLRTVERFNPHTQHWCFISPMLHRRGGVGVDAAGGRLYAVGGHNAPPSQPNAMRTASVEMYDPRTDMWTEVSSLSSPRDSIAVCLLGGKLYAIGGHDGQVYTDLVQVYDPTTNQWSDVASLPSGRAGVSVAAAPRALDLPRPFQYRADPLT